MTAEEFLDKYLHDNAVPWHPDLDKIYGQINIAMIEFAKYHVQKALEKASEEADVTTVDYNDDTIPPIPIWGVSSYSILNTYPLDNIK